MDISKALELLKKAIEEVPRLRKLKYDNQDRVLWEYKVEDILEATFGRESLEYNRFKAEYDRIYHGLNEEQNWQKNYLKALADWETALKSIIEKCETVGTMSKLSPMLEPPKTFIAHGKKTTALEKLRNFLNALGIQPLIVEDQPSKGKALDDKVEHYMVEADCVIILATADDEIEGKFYPRQNVSHEIGLAQKTFSDKIIYLLEENTEFSSNVSPKVWERFTQQSMDKAFITVARELKAFGLIQAVKPR